MLLDVFAVFINANGEEWDDDCRRAEISAVTVAVFNDVCQSGHGDGHRQNDDERGHNRAARGCGLYAAEYRQLFKASKISDIRHFDFRLCLCSFDDSLSLSLHQNPRVSGRI